MAERILLVDDHPLTREALASLLAQHGFDVVGEAADGAEALELAARAPARPRPARPLDARHRRPRRALPRLRDGRSGLRGRRPHRLRHGGEPARRDPRRRGRLPAQERAARADRRLPPRRRATARPRSRARSRGACSSRCATGGRFDGGVPDVDRAAALGARARGAAPARRAPRTDEIAKRLFISEHTVRSHVKSLLRKLGVSSRREALEQLSLARG